MPDVKTTIAEAASAILTLGTWGGHILRATAGHLVTLSQLSSADGTTPTTPTTTAGSAGHVGLDVNITGGTVAIDESTLATAAKQTDGNALLTTLAGIVSAGKAAVTETSAAAILTKLSADPATQTTLAAVLAKQPTGPSLDATTTARFPTGTVPADAEGNSGAIATMSRILSRLQGYNGTTWDMLRAGVVTVGSTFTGMLNALPWGIYHATPTTRSDGQGGPAETDTKGNAQVNLATLISGEDQVNNRLVADGAFTYANITTQATTPVKSGQGLLARVTINKSVALGVVTIYDNTTNSGTIIGTITMPAALLASQISLAFDVKFSTGLTIVTSGASQDITVSYR